MKFCGASDAFDGGKHFRIGASDENILGGGFFVGHRADDLGDLRRGLAFAENDFGITLAEGAVVIDFGEADVLEGEMTKKSGGFGGS